MSDLERLVIDYSEQMILLVEPVDLRIVMANQVAQQILGYSEAELLEKSILDVESSLQDVFYWEDVRNGQFSNIDSQEGLYQCADGSMRTATKSIRKIEQDGKPWLLIQAREVRDELGIEDDLAQTTSQLRATLESTGNGILVIDWQGCVASMNRRLSKMWNLPEDLLLAQDDQAILDCIGAQVVEGEAFRARLREIVEEHETEDVLNLLDGRVFECKSLPQYLDERIIGRVFGFNDITERIRIEQDLIAARERAESANQAKAAFLAMMSHEIRTPMNGVMGMTSLMADTPLNNDQKRYLGIIRSSSDALLSIINDILDFSKIEAQKLTLEIIDFDLRTLLEEFAELNTLRAAEKKLEFRWQLAADVPRRLRGDPGRIRQVLTNLVGNAFKFTKEGLVALRVARLADRGGHIVLHLEVEDTGIGIAEENLAKVFAPFEQADTSTTRKYGGTGLGLAISKQLVEMMEGDISVSSQEGRGTTFSLNVVLGKAVDDRLEEKPSTPASADQGQSPEDGATGAISVERKSAVSLLVVEDNAVNMMVMKGVLAKLGYKNIEKAQDGLEGVEKATLASFDLILMDCQMPKLDGYEATRRLRELGVKVPIIAMTAHAMNGDREKCLEAGMDDSLTKPIAIDTVGAMLDQWLSVTAAPAS